MGQQPFWVVLYRDDAFFPRYQVLLLGELVSSSWRRVGDSFHWRAVPRVPPQDEATERSGADRIATFEVRLVQQRPPSSYACVPDARA